MLYFTYELRGFKIGATDGEIGRVKDFYFDDQTWKVRYVVADTGTWLSGRLVLLSSTSLRSPDRQERVLSAELTRQQVEASPDIGTKPLVSRQKEAEIAAYYGWPLYWEPLGPAVWGGGSPEPVTIPSPVATLTQEPSLRSVRDVNHYHVQAFDDRIGHVEDFLVNDEDWTIRYIIVDTRDWWAGKKVLLSPQAIHDIRWDEAKVFVNLTSDQVKNSPEYDPVRLLDRGYESRLHEHYGWAPYWPPD